MAGSVREKRPGVWQVRVSVGRDPTSGKYRTIAREVRGGRRDAERAAAKLVTELAEGRASIARGTVADLLTRWLEHQTARGLAPKTLHSYRCFARRISEELGSKELRKLTAADLDRFYARLVAGGLSAKSVHHYHATLRAALRQARRWGLIAVSPADDASPPVVATLEDHLRMLAGGRHRFGEGGPVVVGDLFHRQRLAFRRPSHDHRPSPVQVDADVLFVLFHRGPPPSWGSWLGSPECVSARSLPTAGGPTAGRRHSALPSPAPLLSPRCKERFPRKRRSCVASLPALRRTP